MLARTPKVVAVVSCWTSVELPAPDIETRALRPPDVPITPNDTLPPSPIPAPWVLTSVLSPGDPDGLVLLDEGLVDPNPPSIIRPAPGRGWPDEWATPNWWGRVEVLTDTAWALHRPQRLDHGDDAAVPRRRIRPLPDDWMINPDPLKYTGWCEFFKQLVWDYHLGEAFVLCTARYSNNWPARFHVVSPWLVNVELVGGRRRYSIGGVDVTDDMLHVRYQSRTDDAHGHGPLEAGRSRVIAASVLLRYATNLAPRWRHPQRRADAPRRTDQDAVGDAADAVGRGPPVLDGPAGRALAAVSHSRRCSSHRPTWRCSTWPKHNESRICVLLGVPPFLMGLPSGGDSMTYCNVDAIFDYHWRAGLRPKASALMAALSEWLAPSRHDDRAEP